MMVIFGYLVHNGDFYGFSKNYFKTQDFKGKRYSTKQSNFFKKNI